jgi:F-type H+-transporting ATPase subunit b
MNINLTLFAQMVAFAVFVWFTMRYIWPPIVKAMEERQGRIAEGLAAAERGQHEQVLGRQRATELMHEAKLRAADLVSLAQRRAAEIVDEAKADAQAERDRILLAGHSEIAQEHNRLQEEMRQQLAQIALATAAKILQQEIDATRHSDLLEAAVKQI